MRDLSTRTGHTGHHTRPMLSRLPSVLRGTRAIRGAWTTASQSTLVKRSFCTDSSLKPHDEQPRDVIAAMCRAANEGDSGAMKALVAKLANEDFLHKVLTDYQHDSVVVVNDYLLDPRFHKEDVEKFYLDGMEVEGWTDGQKLTDSQWKHAVEKLRDHLATDLFENIILFENVLGPFLEELEEMLKTNENDK